MPLIRFSLLTLVIGILLVGCQKELSLELSSEYIKQANELKELVKGKPFRLVDFYSNIPIDYIEDDGEVKLETDLWGYVSGYLRDDRYLLYDDYTLDIIQNDLKIPGSAEEVLSRTYAIGTDANGVFMRFLDYRYNALTYRLHETSEDHFILSISWSQGATLYSRYEFAP